MRYWTFDVCSLIADYEKNRKTLASIKECLELGRGYMEHPIGATSRGDWELYVGILELRETEYQTYVDMVVERLVLQMWLMDNQDDVYIIDHCGIKNGEELRKIKKIALTKFTNIVMPN